MHIKEVSARSIKDSRTKPTIEILVNGVCASAPAGKSTGVYETPSYHRSLEWNIRFINGHSFDLSVSSFDDLRVVEEYIKKNARLKDPKAFGANALFALESAILKALAQDRGIPLWKVINSRAKKMPVPLGNVIGGGLHSHNKDHPVFQEFLIVPQESSAWKNVLRMKSVHKKLQGLLSARVMNDEGAWQTSLDDEQILSLLSSVKGIRFGIDAAASAFYKKKFYRYKKTKKTRLLQIAFINSLIKKYNLLYIEDPLEEEDFSGFAKIKRSKNHLVTGDDLTATQISRVNQAIRKGSINAMIVKPNQNGSLIELKRIVSVCKKNKVKTILSHRSGETLDSALADFSVGFGTDFIKAGIATKWREVKLNRLVAIEKELGVGDA